MSIQADTTNEVIINDKHMTTDRRSYLCVIMPAYNEGRKIRDNLLYTSKTISKFVKNYRILAVNDGSTDDTKAGIMEAALRDPMISYLSYNTNRGKGCAICTGVQYADAEYIAFLDSDMELDPSMLRYFMKAMLATDADIAIGSKLHKQSHIDYPLVRKLMSFGYFLLLKMMFRLNIRDTQTGIKLFRAQTIKDICRDVRTDGFAFDIEILATATQAGCKIIELPITLNYNNTSERHSKVSVNTAKSVFQDTIRIRRRLRTDRKIFTDNR